MFHGLPAASPTVSVTLFPSFTLPVPRGRPAYLPDAPNTLLAEAFALTACIFQKHLLLWVFSGSLPSFSHTHLEQPFYKTTSVSPLACFCCCCYHESLSLGTLWKTDLCRSWFWKSVSMVGIWVASDGLLGYFKLLEKTEGRTVAWKRQTTWCDLV